MIQPKVKVPRLPSTRQQIVKKIKAQMKKDGIYIRFDDHYENCGIYRRRAVIIDY